jgi:GTP-binding protein
MARAVFRNQFLTLTNGAGILTSIFDRYDVMKSGQMSGRQNGVLVSVETGKALTYSLETLQARGKLFVEHGQEIYNGQIVGLNSRDTDMGVNPTKGKKLDNMRASGKDETIALVPPVRFTLEQALEFIQDDELCEVTPKSIRLRKKILDEGERTRAAKKAKN